MDRRNSRADDEPQRPLHNPDVFDDEYALDPDEDDFMPSVSDGFRPQNARDVDSDRQDHDRNEPARPQITTNKSTDTDLRRVATRNSIAKVPFGQEPVSDGRHPGIPNQGPSSQATSLQHRESVSSTASFATMANSDSPFANGPSHPYAMYSQNAMVRSSSIATASTEQQPPRPLSLRGPTHPYGMYTQNVVVDDAPPIPQVQTTIPVGFPGIGAGVGAGVVTTGYHRQIGPDGEEQDIIGPDGHTEQLPPYSRYPEEGPTKASMAAEASATPVEQLQNPMAASSDALLANVPPASPISPVSPVSPTVMSVAPARLPQQRPETQTGHVAAPRPATTSESASLLTSSDESFSEKVEVARSIRSSKKGGWRRKRLWGKIPMTVALVLLVLLLIFATVLGAAIGTFLSKNKDKGKDNNHDPKKHEDPAAQTLGGNSLFGATPITTPVSGLVPLPTGQFSLPLGFAQESSPNCLTQGNQYAAWSCKMSFAPLKLTITNASSGVATLEAFVPPDGTIQYGLQPPAVTNSSGQLQLVSDLDYKGYGPAWHFSAHYDKIVVLTPDEFAAGASLRKRQDDKPGFRHKFQVQPGDNPWWCVWNRTYIEGYIYAQDNSSAATMTGYPTPNPSDPFSPFNSAAAAATSTIPGTPVATSTPKPTNGVKRRDDPPPPFPRLPPYPRIVKIEERRLPGSPQPFCQKMQLLDNGQLASATSGSGGPIVVWLQEADPSMAEFYNAPPPPPPPSSTANATSRKRRATDKRGDPSDACHCQWMFQ